MKLTPTQIDVLTQAAEQTEGQINLNKIDARVRSRVLEGLLRRGLIIRKADGYQIHLTGYTCLGLPVPNQVEEAKSKTKTKTKTISLRSGTKQATLIALMQRPQGASIDELCEATSWLPHTIRGVFSNTLKKRLGLTVTSYLDRHCRRYCIEENNL